MVRARVAKITSRGREVTSNWMRNVFEAQSFVFYLTFGVLALIVLFGLVMVLSSSAVDSLRANNDAFYVFNRQLGFALAGFAALLFFSILPTAFFFRTGYYLFIGAVAAQLAVIFTPLGVSVNGNKAWLNLMFIKIQPSEFIKLGLILVLASFLHAREDEKFDPKRYSQRAFWIGFVALASILLGGDMGTSIIVALIVLTIVFSTGVPLREFGAPLIIAGLTGVGLILSGSSRSGRFSAWLSNTTDDMANSYAWQSVHAIWAVAAGRINGVGLGNSKMKWSWIPEVENDFIFAIICEEFGLIGAIALIILFVTLICCLYVIYRRARSNYSRYVIAGVLAWIMIQATVNICVVLQILPVLGVPLPLISAGGSSLITGMAAIGIVLAFERENVAALGDAAARPRILLGSRSQKQTSASARAKTSSSRFTKVGR